MLVLPTHDHVFVRANRRRSGGHAGLVQRGLNDQHFDAVAGHLEATLRELGLANDLIQEALAIVGGQRDVVLNR